MPPPTPQATATALRQLGRSRRIAGSMHRPVRTAAARGTVPRSLPFSSVASRRSIFSDLASAAFGIKPSSSSSSASSSSSSASANSTTISTERAPKGGLCNVIATTRTLPYAVPELFEIVADVDAYASFLPHCTASRVTQWRTINITSPPASYPARADLTIGWGPLTQSYSSRVYCVPGHGVVEAVSGSLGEPTLTAAEWAELGLDKARALAELDAPINEGKDPFESLVTRWQLVPAGQAASEAATPATRVELRIRFQFYNQFYNVAAAKAGSEMATTMIEAFEKRAVAKLGSPIQIKSARR